MSIEKIIMVTLYVRWRYTVGLDVWHMGNVRVPLSMWRKYEGPQLLLFAEDVIAINMQTETIEVSIALLADTNGKFDMYGSSLVKDDMDAEQFCKHFGLVVDVNLKGDVPETPVK